MCIPWTHHSVKSNLAYLTCQVWDAESREVVLHVHNLLVKQVHQSPFQWIVNTIVHLWPHPLHSKVLLIKIPNGIFQGKGDTTAKKQLHIHNCWVFFYLNHLNIILSFTQHSPLLMWFGGMVACWGCVCSLTTSPACKDSGKTPCRDQPELGPTCHDSRLQIWEKTKKSN